MQKIRVSNDILIDFIVKGSLEVAEAKMKELYSVLRDSRFSDNFKSIEIKFNEETVEQDKE